MITASGASSTTKAPKLMRSSAKTPITSTVAMAARVLGSSTIVTMPEATAIRITTLRECLSASRRVPPTLGCSTGRAPTAASWP